jgi:pyruvate formate lyase activating enzyme
MPLIPTINDGMQNIKETAGFLHELGENTLRIELMPYHRLGKGKYESLNREYHLSDIAVADPVSLESVKRAFVTEGITCLISR